MQGGMGSIQSHMSWDAAKSEKASQRMGENICQSYIWQGANIQTI